MSHLGDVAGDLEAERKRKGDLRWIQVTKVGDKVDNLQSRSACVVCNCAVFS